MMPAQTAKSKPATVRIINLRAGDYKVLSTDGITWYYVNVARISCTCPAGAHGFVNCKQRGFCRHIAAAKVVAKMHHDREQASRQAAAPQKYHDSAGLMELYS